MPRSLSKIKLIYDDCAGCGQIVRSFSFNLETAVGSQKSAQALGAPSKIKKCLITHKVTTNFLISPGTPIPYASFLRSTAVSRFNSPTLCLKRSKHLTQTSPSLRRLLIADRLLEQAHTMFLFNAFPDSVPTNPLHPCPLPVP